MSPSFNKLQDIHKIFQRELYKLRLTTARSYSKIITDTQNAQSYAQGSSVRLAAQVCITQYINTKVAGIGPVFKLKLAIENTGKKVLGNLRIMFCFNQTLYKIRKPYFILPSLIPGLIYLHEVVIECIQESAGSDNVRIVIFSSTTTAVPLISYVITMPISELFF